MDAFTYFLTLLGIGLLTLFVQYKIGRTKKGSIIVFILTCIFIGVILYYDTITDHNPKQEYTCIYVC